MQYSLEKIWRLWR